MLSLKIHQDFIHIFETSKTKTNTLTLNNDVLFVISSSLRANKHVFISNNECIIKDIMISDLLSSHTLIDKNYMFLNISQKNLLKNFDHPISSYESIVQYFHKLINT